MKGEIIDARPGIPAGNVVCESTQTVFPLVGSKFPWQKIPVRSYLFPRGLIAASLALIVAIVLSSCGTISGIGHDVRYLGNAVEKAAR